MEIFLLFAKLFEFPTQTVSVRLHLLIVHQVCMPLLHLPMPNEYFIHVICQLMFGQQKWYGINNIRKIMFDINMYGSSDLPNNVTYCNWRTGMVFNLMVQKNYKYLITINCQFYSTLPVGHHLRCLPIAHQTFQSPWRPHTLGVWSPHHTKKRWKEYNIEPLN